MQSKNWGIIGPGNIAHDFARDLELIRPHQNITSVLGPKEDTAKSFADKFHVKNTFTDLEAFIQHGAVDIVYIATPHPQHYEQAMACLKNGIHVLCEKPMTINAAQSAALIKTSEEQRCFLMEGMWIRFLPSIKRVVELVESDKIGKVISIKASMGYKAPKDENSRYFNPALGGGSLLDLGIYTIFLTHLLLGKPDSIHAAGLLTDKGIDSTCGMLLGYDSGAHALLDSSLLTQSDLPAEIAGEKGVIRILNPWFEKAVGLEVQMYNEDKKFEPIEWEGHGLQYEAEEVLRCVEVNRIESELFPHSFSREISETLDAVRDQVHINYKKYEKV